MHYAQRAVSRKRGCMPARTFVRICKCTARPSLCETPACVKPPPRYRQAADSVERFSQENGALRTVFSGADNNSD
jgi:hypothetical protein